MTKAAGEVKKMQHRVPTMAMPPSILVPLRPIQARSRAKVEAILATAERQIAEAGLDEFSLPRLAERLGIPRATVYRYFPSPQALLLELAQGYLREREQLIPAAWGDTDCWRTGIARLIRAAAAYYITRPTARAVLLHNGMTPEVAAVLRETVDRLAATVRNLFEQRAQVPRLPSDPDPYAISVEVVTAIFTLSERRHRQVTDTFIDEACRVIESYMERRIGER